MGLLIVYMASDGWRIIRMDQMPRRTSGSDGSAAKGHGIPSAHGRKSGAEVLSINRRKNLCKQPLESILSTVLRSEDNELDEILKALSDLSNILKSQNFDSAAVGEALKKAAVWAVEKSMLD